MEQHETWRAALADIDCPAILTDDSGLVSFINPAAEQRCGKSCAEVIGKPLAGVFRDAQQSAEVALLKERMAAIVESSDDMIVSKTLDGIITSWNHGAEKLLGYSADEVIGKHVSLLMPPDSNEDWKMILERIRQGEKVDHHYTHRRHKNGQIIDVSLTVSPIHNEAGEIIGASKVGRDISQLRNVELLKNRLAAIVESSDDIIVSKSLDGIITSWNKGAERILGYTADEVVGKHISLLMPGEHVEDMHRILDKIRRGEKVQHFETKRIRKDGRIVDVSLTVSPIRDAQGLIVGASKIGRDITQQKLIEAQRQEADRRKDEFLAMLAHELRNPLASINNAIQLFGKLETEEELEWAKEVVHRQVKHLARLIDDLLDVSRITRGKISVKMESLNLGPIINNAVETVGPLLEERKHEMVVSVSPGGLRLRGDALRLEQILVNLLSNAAKYTDAGGKVTIAARNEGDAIVVEVQDNGIGIPPELLPQVFDLFVQGDRHLARSEGGLGIGLTLVQKLVEMHGGGVTAESAGIGQGSKFTLRFPALKPEPAVKPQPRKELPRMARQSSRILVVDDNADTANGLLKLFKLLGHDVAVAYDGRAALETARAHKPEIIVLDIGLPGMNGYEVARQLRQESCCKNALIIAVSGYGQEEDRRKSREAGFDHHLVKPVDFESLLTLLA